MFEDRLFRCGDSDYYGDEILHANEMHTSRALRAIAEAGFDGIWLHGSLRELVPTDLFRNYVTRSDLRLDALRTLCRRARRYGLGVWLYFTEPLGLPASHRFWRDHPDLRGHGTKILDRPLALALCPSTEPVRR